MIANRTVRQQTETTYNITEYFQDVDRDQLSLNSCYYSFNGEDPVRMPHSIFVNIDSMSMLILVRPKRAIEAGDYIVTVEVSDSYASTSI